MSIISLNLVKTTLPLNWLDDRSALSRISGREAGSQLAGAGAQQTVAPGIIIIIIIILNIPSELRYHYVYKKKLNS